MGTAPAAVGPRAAYRFGVAAMVGRNAGGTGSKTPQRKLVAACAPRKIHYTLPGVCATGVSINRTSEIRLVAETGRSDRSAAYLLGECSREEAAMTC